VLVASLALDGSEAAVAEGRQPTALRYADLGLLAVALPVFLVADLPLVGYATAAVAWLAQHLLFAWTQRRATDSLRRGDRKAAMGVVGISMVGRLWIVTLPILVVGIVVEREAGLAAAVLAVALVTVHLASVAITRLLYSEEAGA
jgi:hypothetical protein